MALESTDDIAGLVPGNPDGNDRIRDGDNHIRLMKQVLKNSVGNSGDLVMSFDTRDAAVASDNMLEGKFVQTAGQSIVGDGAGAYYQVVAPGTGTPDGETYIDITGTLGTPQLFLIFKDTPKTILYERLTATAAQTLFNLTNPYTTGANTLQIFRNGVRQVTPTDYAETSTTSFTVNTPANNGDTFDCFVVSVQVAATVASAVSVSPAGDIAATDVQAALEELDTEKSATTHDHDADYLQIANNLSELDDATGATLPEQIKNPGPKREAAWNHIQIAADRNIGNQVGTVRFGRDSDNWDDPNTTVNNVVLSPQQIWSIFNTNETNVFGYTATEVVLGSTFVEVQSIDVSAIGTAIELTASYVVYNDTVGVDYGTECYITRQVGAGSAVLVSALRLFNSDENQLIPAGLGGVEGMGMGTTKATHHCHMVCFDKPSTGSYTYKLWARTTVSTGRIGRRGLKAMVEGS